MQTDTNKEIEEAYESFDEGIGEFRSASPNLRDIKEAFDKIEKEFLDYEGDFRILLFEDERYGGGLAKGAHRIVHMKESLEALERMISSAEEIVKSNPVFAIFENKAKAARAAYTKLRVAVALLES